jgi:type IV pilus assembly protein PilC
MLTYAYRARNVRGEAISGVAEARSESDALRQLQRDGLTVTDIRLGARPIDVDAVRVKHSANQVKREEVISLSSQLSVMLETGVPLGEALEAYVAHTRSKHLRKVMEVVTARITGGMPFSAAISDFPKMFPKLMVSLMEASEASGTMGMMLGRVADYLGKERRTARQIKGALTYPLVMITLAVVVTGFLIAWVLPRFAKIYESREAALPTLTRIVMKISDAMTQHWLLLSVVTAAIVGGVISLRLFPAGIRLVDTIKLKTPVIGPIFTRYYLTRACRTLGTLLASGVGLVDGIRIVKGTTNNVHWRELWTRIELSMNSGHTVSEVVTSSWLVPPPVAQMIAAGERTGKLPEVLDRIADSTEHEFEDAVKNATQLLEPAMIIFMGVTIGGIAIALLLPIFNVASVMKN